MACFEKVSAAIGPVYSRLTANAGSDGGSAYLDLEDSRSQVERLSFDASLAEVFTCLCSYLVML